MNAPRGTLFERSFSLELPQYSAIDNAAHRHIEDELLRAYQNKLLNGAIAQDETDGESQRQSSDADSA